jgi:hypothetical protein
MHPEPVVEASVALTETNETQMQVQDDVVKAIAAELAVAITQLTGI